MAPLTNVPVKLWLAREHWEQMAEDVARRAPEEACGLVAGREGCSLAVYPVVNALRSAVRFRMDPQQQVKYYLEILERGWDLAAIYHSHPQGPASPSETDLAEAAYPEAVYLIWSFAGNQWICKGFRIDQGQFSEVPVAKEV